MDDTIKLLNEEEKEANDRLKSVTLKEYKSMNKTINGLKLATTTKSADYTLTSADDVCIVTASCTITLPAVASSTGKVFVIKANTGGITSIVIDGNASETIDGATTKTIATDLSTVTIVCTGSAWFIQSYYVGGAL